MCTDFHLPVVLTELFFNVIFINSKCTYLNFESMCGADAAVKWKVGLNGKLNF